MERMPSGGTRRPGLIFELAFRRFGRESGSGGSVIEDCGDNAVMRQ